MPYFFKVNEDNRVNQIAYSSESTLEDYTKLTVDVPYASDTGSPYILDALLVDGELTFDETFISGYNRAVSNLNSWDPNEAHNKLQEILDAKAQEWGYDSMLAAASYTTSSVATYKAEADALIAWRDASWEWIFDEATRSYSEVELFDNQPTLTVPDHLL